MAGGQYEPSDSRNVTLRPTAPGKPSGWREQPGENQPSDDLAPVDQREVHGNGDTSGRRWHQSDEAPASPAGPTTADRADADGARNRSATGPDHG